MCQDVCEVMMALKPMPNDVNPEAKTDTEHDSKQRGEQSFALLLYMFLCLHVVKGLIKDELFIAYCSLSVLRFVPLQFGKECAQEDPHH